MPFYGPYNGKHYSNNAKKLLELNYYHMIARIKVPLHA